MKLNQHWTRAKSRQPESINWSTCREDGTTKFYDDNRSAPWVGSVASVWKRHAEHLPSRLRQYAAESTWGNPHIEEIEGIPMSISSIEFACWLSHIEPYVVDGFQVLEIGAGYGGFARTLLERFPGLRYTIVDLDFVRQVSSKYLAEHQKEVAFSDDVPRTLCPDLVVQTRGFMEMSAEELNHYFEYIQTSLRPGGLLFTVNRWEKHTVLAEYPFDRRWDPVFVRQWDGNWNMGELLLRRTKEPQTDQPTVQELVRRAR